MCFRFEISHVPERKDERKKYYNIKSIKPNSLVGPRKIASPWKLITDKIIVVMEYKQKFDEKEGPFFERNLLVFNDKINHFEINNETFFFLFFSNV